MPNDTGKPLDALCRKFVNATDEEAQALFMRHYSFYTKKRRLFIGIGEFPGGAEKSQAYRGYSN